MNRLNNCSRPLPQLAHQPVPPIPSPCRVRVHARVRVVRRRARACCGLRCVPRASRRLPGSPPRSQRSVVASLSLALSWSFRRHRQAGRNAVADHAEERVDVPPVTCSSIRSHQLRWAYHRLRAESGTSRQHAPARARCPLHVARRRCAFTASAGTRGSCHQRRLSCAHNPPRHR